MALSQRTRDEVALRLTGALCGGLLVGAGIFTDNRTDEFWRIALVLVLVAIGGVLVMHAANVPWNPRYKHYAGPR